VLTDTLFINFDQKITRRLNLRIDSAKILLEPNYFITSPISLSSDTIVLTGPKGILDAMPDTLSISIKDQNIDEDYHEQISIDFESDQLFIKSPSKINVQFSIRQFLPYTIQVPLEALNATEDITLLDSIITVSYYMPEELNESINNKSFQCIADFSSISKNDSTLTPQLNTFPPLVKQITISPEKVRFTRHE